MRYNAWRMSFKGIFSFVNAWPFQIIDFVFGTLMCPIKNIVFANSAQILANQREGKQMRSKWEDRRERTHHMKVWSGPIELEIVFVKPELIHREIVAKINKDLQAVLLVTEVIVQLCTSLFVFGVFEMDLRPLPVPCVLARIQCDFMENTCLLLRRLFFRCLFSIYYSFGKEKWYWCSRFSSSQTSSGYYKRSLHR